MYTMDYMRDNGYTFTFANGAQVQPLINRFDRNFFMHNERIFNNNRF